MTVFWFIFSVVVLALFQVFYYSRSGLKRVGYSRRFSRSRAFAGETLEMVETLTNDKLTPLPWLRVESKISPNIKFGKTENLNVEMDSFHRSLFYLGPFKKIVRSHAVHVTRRGYYNCGNISLTVGDLLGLAHKSGDYYCPEARLIIYPRLKSRDEMPDEALKWQGEISVRRYIDPDPMLITGIREYRPGDLERDIHWAATARTGQLHVKLRDYTISPRLLIVFNTQISHHLWRGMSGEEKSFLENGVDICATLAAWASGQGMNVGFLCNGSSVIGADRSAHVSVEPDMNNLDAILQALALLDIKMQLTFTALLDAQLEKKPSGLDILCICAYWNEELEIRAGRLRAMGNYVEHIPVTGGGGK